MREEKIVLKAKRKRQLKTLVSSLGDVGFNRVEYGREKLVVERLSEDLQGNVKIDYSILFGKNSIEFSYFIDGKSNATQRRFELLPVFLNVIILAKSHYEVDPTPLFDMIISLLSELKGALNKETIDVVSQLNELKEKHTALLKKYEEVVRASEENARLLLEAEQKYQEILTRVQKLESLSDDILMEEIYDWIKVHNGAIDISEFAKTHSLPPARVEEGLEMLIREGYIKKR